MKSAVFHRVDGRLAAEVLHGIWENLIVNLRDLQLFVRFGREGGGAFRGGLARFENFEI